MSKSIAILCCLILCVLTSYPQQPQQQSSATSAGVALYEQGNIEGAIKLLREAVKKWGDSSAWHYLGLALARQGKSGAAREALGKAIDLRASAVRLEFSRNEEWRDAQLTNLKTMLRDQIESQNKLLENLTNREAVEKGKSALERTQTQAACVEQSSKIMNGSNSLKREDMAIQRAKILKKPEPAFPDSARKDGVTGTVLLKAIFAADGSVQHLELMRSPDGRLTEASIQTAKMIKFIPETYCGKPVSSPTQLEYSFHTFTY